jgi:hypothetical protein
MNKDWIKNLPYEELEEQSYFHTSMLFFLMALARTPGIYTILVSLPLTWLAYIHRGCFHSSIVSANLF